MSESVAQCERERILAQLQNLDALRPMSASTLELVQLCQDSNVDTQQIRKIIESEPAIAARVLSVANSPLYGYSRRIASISHAIVILGSRNITQLAVSFAANNLFCDGADNAAFCRQLYKHSLGCALVARSLADIDSKCDPDKAFLGGLLHDIGKLALIQLAPARYAGIQGRSGYGRKYLDMELVELGVSHEEVGAICARRWGLPADISMVISNHHGNDDKPVSTVLSQVVEAADSFAHHEGIGCEPKKKDAQSRCENALIESLQPETCQLVVETAISNLEILAGSP